MVGQSGMGKSTLLKPADSRCASPHAGVSERLKGGKQTTTASRGFSFTGESALIVPPASRSSGSTHLTSRKSRATFSEFKGLSVTVRFQDCRHLEEPDAPSCGARRWQHHAERYEFIGHSLSHHSQEASGARRQLAASAIWEERCALLAFAVSCATRHYREPSARFRLECAPQVWIERDQDERARAEFCSSSKQKRCMNHIGSALDAVNTQSRHSAAAAMGGVAA